MAFNWKAFQTAFMDDTARRIDERLKEAKDYRERQRELADKSKLQIQKRKALANLAVGKASQLSRLGVTDEQIAAAVASGPDALFTFADEVIEYANKQNIKKFTPTQIDALIETPELVKEDLGEEFTLDSFIKQSYGLAKPTPSSEPGTDVPLGLQLFGFGAKDRARAELDRDPYFEGYSIMDLNTLASQEAYESLVPGAYATFGGVPYNSVKVAGDFDEELRQLIADIPAVIRADEVALEKEKKVVTERLIRRYAAAPWGKSFLNDKTLSVDIAKDYPEIYQSFMDPEDPQNETIAGIQAVVNEELGQPQTFTDKDGNEETYKFTFDEEGKPIAGSLNGRTIPPNMLEQALELAKEKGLYKNHVKVMPSEGDIITETLPSLDESVEDTADAIAEDTLEALVEKPETKTSLDMYNNPTDKTYLVKIKGKIGTFRVKGEDLSAIPEAQIGTNVTITEDTDPDKRYKKKSRSALERDFTPMGDERKSLVEKPEDVTEEAETPAQKEDVVEIINNFASSLTDFQKKTPRSMPSAWKRWAKQNNISPALTKSILNNLIKESQKYGN